jgi:glutathione S-transferase
MILIGQYDSPFVRRVGIALRLYGLAFEHRPWSTFAEAEKIRPFNPLHRVPTLVLDDGVVLSETLIILDHLDRQVPPERALLAAGSDRPRQLAILALAGGIADKAVSLFYEKRLHAEVSEAWVKRCTGQITATLAALETERARRASDHWFGERITHADIALATGLRFLNDSHPGLFAMAAYPRLAAGAARCEALPVFREIGQPFIPPA